MSSKSKFDGANKGKASESIWKKAFVANAEWPDKVSFFDHGTCCNCDKNCGIPELIGVLNVLGGVSGRNLLDAPGDRHSSGAMLGTSSVERFLGFTTVSNCYSRFLKMYSKDC